MTGGLIQIITSGKQDIYLTINPQITFFKKVFRRYTNFSLELIEINPEQPAEYNSIVSFILNTGDLIHRCYFEIDLPLLSFPDSYIKDLKYIKKKETDLENLNKLINEWKDYYDNLKGFADIEIPLYRNLYNLLQTENISINFLKDEVGRYNLINKESKDLYKNKIDEMVFDLVNISGYIISINKLIINEEITDNYDKCKFISRYEILNKLEEMYKNIIEYLKFYNNKKIYYNKLKNEKVKPNQIEFNYAPYLGHNYIDSVKLEIGGLELESYQKDILHINQMHYIKPDYMNNYLEMIGHYSELNEFNNLSKGSTKILVPLIFWFNKNAGSSLPLVSLQYSQIVINAKISELKNIINFENFGKMFDNLLILTINNLTNNKFILNKNLIYKNVKYNIENKSIIYYCIYINNELLKNVFPDLTDDEINIILINNGSEYTLNEITKMLNPNLSDEEIINTNNLNGNNKQWIINRNQWISFMINIKNQLYSSFAFKVGSYYPYIDFNLYYSLIENPKIKLICEAVYLDDVERAKFSNSKLEYVIEVFNENTFNFKSQENFDCELSFNNPCKELLWYIQPQIYLDGFSGFGQNTKLLFDTFEYFSYDPINKQKLTFNQLDAIFNNVDFNYWTYYNSYKYLNNILPNGIYYKSFCLYPEDSQPSGTVNFREIRGKQFKIDLNKNFIKEYLSFLQTLYKFQLNIIPNKNFIVLKFIAKQYDLLVIHKGQATLLFNS